MFGTAMALKGEFERAEQILKRLLVVDPSNIQARLWLSRVFIKTGRVADAKMFAKEAVNLNVQDSLAQAQLSETIQAAANMLPQSLCEQIADASPMPSNTYFGLGVALWGLGRPGGAVCMLEKALEHDPKHMAAIRELYNIYNETGDVRNELRISRLAVEADPAFSNQAKLTIALIGNGMIAEAYDRFEHLESMNHEDPLAQSQLGFICQLIGRIDSANSYFTSSIVGQPEQGFAYYWVTQNNKISMDDIAFVDRMKDVFARDRLELSQRESLAFAIGKALEDLGEFEEAMKYFEEGNLCGYRFHFGEMAYDDLYVQALEKRFEDSLISDVKKGNDSYSPTPIFIVGMIRSGTTLMEQILSSHPDVGAAGELNFWEASYKDFPKTGGPGADKIEALCNEYCEMLRSFGEGKQYVTDKRPDNFLRLGFLGSVFPRSKIIHMRRHPADNCVSVFSTLNSSPMLWAYRKESISQFYGFYSRVMDRWHSILPPGRILDVSYEDLINDPERILKGVCRFCEIEWDPAVLQPEKNPRPVVTPSVAQVRKQIYTSSIARWKRYEPWLGAISALIPDEERGQVVSS
jgi:tetratricopeptide (TPR) repeat protein